MYWIYEKKMSGDWRPLKSFAEEQKAIEHADQQQQAWKLASSESSPARHFKVCYNENTVYEN